MIFGRMPRKKGGEMMSNSDRSMTRYVLCKLRKTEPKTFVPFIAFPAVPLRLGLPVDHFPCHLQDREADKVF